jgi:ADP-ribosylglycohydrolase
MIDPRDRYRGALLGLATGDALGTTLEFHAPGSFKKIDELQRYTRWADHAHWSSNGTVFDIGNTVCKTLVNFRTSRSPHSGPSDEYSAGNGPPVRLAALPLFFSKSPETAIEKSGESSRTTHGAPAAIDGCRYMGALMVGALNGASKQESLSDHFSPIPGYWDENPLVAQIAEIAAGSIRHREPSVIAGSGYVVKSLASRVVGFSQPQRTA